MSHLGRITSDVEHRKAAGMSMAEFITGTPDPQALSDAPCYSRRDDGQICGQLHRRYGPGGNPLCDDCLNAVVARRKKRKSS